MSSTRSWAPWEAMHHWRPFEIDALGLVTLLGAEEVNHAVGRLISSAYVEYLPLLGAFVIAGDRFTEKAAGFHLYNISKGIHTTDLAGWLTRWMLSQDFESTRSFVVWKVTPPKSRFKENLTAFLISFVFNGFLVAMTVLSRDWYGFTNAVSMIISVMVRTYVIGQQRAGIDNMINVVIEEANIPPKPESYDSFRLEYQRAKKQKKEAKKSPRKQRKRFEGTPNNLANLANPGQRTQTPTDSSRESKEADPHVHFAQFNQGSSVPKRPKSKSFTDDNWPSKSNTELTKLLSKVLVIQQDSKAVTFWIPNELLIPPSVFIQGPNIIHPKWYTIVRAIGWLVFAVHIVAIGMAKLASQLYTVVLLVVPTVLLVYKHGCDDSKWNETFSRWRRMIYGRFHGEQAPKPEPESTDKNEFKKMRECWIGSRLKAEIYEWPESYEFVQEEHGEKGEWTSRAIDPGEDRERSTKRQDLYAWLALTQDEEESMDKWDLFPHIRHNNMNWWREYKLKKKALKCNTAFGPQPDWKIVVPTTDDNEGYEEPNEMRMRFLRRGRTGTENFGDLCSTGGPPSRNTSVMAGSSAFPAMTAHSTVAKINEAVEEAIYESDLD